MPKKAQVTPIAAMSPVNLALLRLMLAQADGDPRPALVEAIRLGALVDVRDPKTLAWVGDVLEGRNGAKRGRGRPVNRPTGWGEALSAMQDRKVADRFDYWRAELERDRGAAQQQVRAIAKLQQRAVDETLFDTRRDPRRRKPSDLAAEIVAWELRRDEHRESVILVRRDGQRDKSELVSPSITLTAATVKRAVTRARKNQK